MTDDIATRLREMWGNDDRCIWCEKHMDSQSSPHREVCDLMEAADEIKRLRAERNQWKQIAERMYDIMLAHETVEHDVWNQAIEDCWKLSTGQ
jgi:hypothetical protein